MTADGQLHKIPDDHSGESMHTHDGPGDDAESELRGAGESKKDRSAWTGRGKGRAWQGE